jgi:hypothetical protein
MARGNRERAEAERAALVRLLGEAMKHGDFSSLCEHIAMHATALLLLALVFGSQSPAPPGGPAPARATLPQLAWLAGEWTGTQGRASIEERWTPAGGGAMLAVSRTIANDRLVAFEFLRIVERGGGLVYIAQPNGRPPTEFALTTIEAASATFENPSHDFPKIIRYSRRDDGSLEATISGANGDRAQSFVFTRHSGR